MSILILAAVTSHAQECEYPIEDLSKCERRTARASHVPSVNGCGPEGSTVKFPQGVGAADSTAACNAHDVCYETCNSDKSACDAGLASAARAACLVAFPRPTGAEQDEGWDRRAICFSRARTYGSAVSTFGKAAYDSAQSIACECCPPRYGGTFSSSLSSTDVNYSVTGTVVWEQIRPDNFRPTGMGEVMYSLKCGNNSISYRQVAVGGAFFVTGAHRRASVGGREA